MNEAGLEVEGLKTVSERWRGLQLSPSAQCRCRWAMGTDQLIGFVLGGLTKGGG